ncbi:hypothetical protein BBK14_24320 [Parafrankia soli]|uniref:MazG nucleotide pyrophosphohydrolase n=1 Tax=Parafrankia soli TaxID=2599596 RepID=A0A1S1PNJ1_9ACTN|nr:hypothetical protein [Parafrankia soli]OHV23250.1 hypothetical protein BBK14_24320 [Parafrankia soli]
MTTTSHPATQASALHVVTDDDVTRAGRHYDFSSDGGAVHDPAGLRSALDADRQHLAEQRRAADPAPDDLSALPVLAQVISAALIRAFPDSDEQVRQTLALAEEAGEFVQAARRYLGMARTPGELEPVTAELADVVITAFVTAEAFGIDLPAAIATKTSTVLTRGWRNTPAPTTA